LLSLFSVIELVEMLQPISEKPGRVLGAIVKYAITGKFREKIYRWTTANMAEINNP